MFAYCGNNPISRSDATGCRWWDCGDFGESIKEKIREALRNGHNALADMGIDTAGIGAFLLDMYESEPGVYHAKTDCWQQYFGYNSMYDFFFDVGTDMSVASFEFEYDDCTYVIWVWKADYINLGAGAELGIYYGGGPHWFVDTSLSMYMTMTLSYKGSEIINHSQNTWWITGFNSNYTNVQACDLTATYTVFFNNPGLYSQFSQTWNGRAGWICDATNCSATLRF